MFISFFIVGQQKRGESLVRANRPSFLLSVFRGRDGSCSYSCLCLGEMASERSRLRSRSDSPLVVGVGAAVLCCHWDLDSFLPR